MTPAASRAFTPLVFPQSKRDRLCKFTASIPRQACKLEADDAMMFTHDLEGEIHAIVRWICLRAN